MYTIYCVNTCKLRLQYIIMKYLINFGLVFLMSSLGYLWLISWTTRDHGHLTRLANKRTLFRTTTIHGAFESQNAGNTAMKLGGFYDNAGTLGLAREREDSVFQTCQRYLTTNSANSSDKWVIITESSRKYQCDMLALCHKEDSWFEYTNVFRTQALGLCPCLPKTLGTVVTTI